MEKDFSYLKMQDPWKAPYLYRERVNKESELFDSINGCYPNEEKINTNIILNLRAGTDSAGRVISIDYYKVRDLYNGHGRPATKNLELNKSDEKVFSKILEKNTISRADKIIDDLLFQGKEKGLNNGWKILSHTANKVLFQAPEGNNIQIPMDRILNALEISHVYIEILTSKDFWVANSDVLKIEDCDPLLGLFKLVDTSDYFNREELYAAAKQREYLVRKNYCYRELCEAVSLNDIKKAREFKQYAEVGNEYDVFSIPPLYTAIQNRNLPMAKLLLANGASINKFFYKDDEEYTPLTAVVELQWDEAFKLCLKHKFIPDCHECTIEKAQEVGRPDYILMLLKKGCIFTPNKNTLKFDIEVLNELSKYPGISWLPMHLEKAYSSGNMKTVKAMLKSIVAADKLNEKGSWNNRQDSLQEQAVEWIIKKKDINLLRYCVVNDFKIQSGIGDFWENLIDVSDNWGKYVPLVFESYTYYLSSLQNAFHIRVKERDIHGCKKLLKVYGAKVDLPSIFYSSSDHLGTSQWYKPDEHMLRFIIDNFQFPETFYEKPNDLKQWDPNRQFGWIFQGVIPNGSKELCLHLFETIPEIFQYSKLSSELMFYCYRREIADDVRLIAEEKTCPILYKRLSDWISKPENVDISSSEFKDIIQILINADAADTYEFSRALRHIRFLEDDTENWMYYAEAIAASLSNNESDEKLQENRPLRNKDVCNELNHIYNRALKISEENKSDFISYFLKKIIDGLQEYA